MCCHSCFGSKVVSFGSAETPKLAVLLFRETAEANLLVSDSVEMSVSSSFGCFDMNRVSDALLWALVATDRLRQAPGTRHEALRYLNW